MKITKQYLRGLIKEEIDSLSEEKEMTLTPEEIAAYKSIESKFGPGSIMFGGVNYVLQGDKLVAVPAEQQPEKPKQVKVGTPMEIPTPATRKAETPGGTY